VQSSQREECRMYVGATFLPHKQPAEAVEHLLERERIAELG
jgi:hypothetical protein